MLKAISTITNALGALNYKGTWNASTNNPTLADGTGAKGDYYVTSTAGTQTFGGLQLFFGIGDWIVYNGAVWQRVEGGSDGNFANVTLTSTDAGAAAAPLLDLYRDSATPAASDTLGEIEFNGEDSAGNKQQYAVIHGSILSPTSTAEAGQIHFETATAGASTEKMIIGTTNLVINDIGAVFNVRIEGDTDANLFYTDATNSRVGIGLISPTEKLDVVGNIKLSGSVIPASGFGIDFAATSGTGLSELLADYEEGLWTPTLVADGTNFTSVTYDSNTGGRYVKVGKLVHIQCWLRTDSITVGLAAGNLTVGGLPFTVAASSGITNDGQSNAAIGYSGAFTAVQPTSITVQANSTVVYLWTRTSNTVAPITLVVANAGTGADSNYVTFTATYVST
jgi:hypothetical protein